MKKAIAVCLLFAAICSFAGCTSKPTAEDAVHDASVVADAETEFASLAVEKIDEAADDIEDIDPAKAFEEMTMEQAESSEAAEIVEPETEDAQGSVSQEP